MGHSDGINFVPHTTDGIDFQPHAPTGPPKTPYEGTHFSNDSIPGGVLHGARRGSSPEASDSARIQPIHTDPNTGDTTQVGPSAPPGVHVVDSGATAHPSIGRRPHAHKVKGNFAIADVEKNPVWNATLQSAYQQAKQGGLDDKTAFNVAINSCEHAIKNAGFDGYTSSKNPGSTLLFGDHAIATT